MIPLTDTARALAESHAVLPGLRVESWLGTVLLADSVPVDSGSEDVDRSSAVPESISLTIPRRKDAFDWTPTYDAHPLAANGQRLRVLVSLETTRGQVELVQRGWFVITESTPDENSVRVTAKGMLHLLAEARLVSPLTSSGTFFSMLRTLVGPELPIIFSGVSDRSVPTALNFDDDRLGAINTLLDALPADARVTEEGVLLITPATQSVTSILDLTNEVGGTVITAIGTSTRDGAYNCVVARGTDSTGATVQGVSYDYAGSHAFGGPFNRLPVPYFYESPLLTTNAQCQAAADTRLTRLQRQTSRAFTVELLPNPALQVGDVISLTTDTETDLLCSVEELSLPYTADGGSMTLVVRTI